LATLLVLFVFLFRINFVFADQDTDKLKQVENKIAEYEAKIKEAQSKQRTLANTITVINNQIYLTQAKIDRTNGEITQLQKNISALSGKINGLNQSLSDTTKLLKERVENTYKNSFLPSLLFIFYSEDFRDLFSRLKYLKAVQQHDKEMLFSMEEAKQNYDKQKALKERKQAELKDLQTYLENQTIILAQQKSGKEDLLKITKNNEKNFQRLLDQARNEFNSIQAIISHRGSETEVGPVKKSERIATVIPGSSCNSAGSHLHFMVVDSSGKTQNPFHYLKPVAHQNCSGPGSCSEGDPFNPSGSWDWPLSPPIRMNQGYGSTWATRNTWVRSIYSFHNGIDIVGSNNIVRSTIDGILYRGSYSGSRGCRLRYVRVEDSSGLSTYYLHVNY